MKNLQSVVDVAVVVRDFLQQEARTLPQSRGKMLSDKISTKQEALRNAG